MISYSDDISTIHNRHIGLLFCIFFIMKKSVFQKLRGGVHIAPGTSCAHVAPVDAIELISIVTVKLACSNIMSSVSDMWRSIAVVSTSGWRNVCQTLFQ